MMNAAARFLDRARRFAPRRTTPSPVVPLPPPRVPPVPPPPPPPAPPPPPPPPGMEKGRGGDDPRLPYVLGAMWIGSALVCVALPIASWTMAFRGPTTSVPWLVTACVSSTPFAFSIGAEIVGIVHDNYVHCRDRK